MVEIFLSVYNSEEYLEKQLDSLLSQHYSDIIITVRDDGSTDRSAEIIGRYIEKYPRKIRRITTHTEDCTEGTSFSELMKNAIIGDNDTCYAFCGRGEIWKPDKLSKEMEKMSVLKQTESFHTPRLVCCDGEKVTEIPSVSAYKNLRNDKFTLKQALAECPLLGGSCLMDRAMLSLCANMPENVDYGWWIAATAASFGKTVYIPEQYVQYSGHIESISENTYEQAAVFLKIFDPKFNPYQRKAVTRYADCKNAGRLVRVFRILFGGYLRKGLKKAVKQIFSC